MLAIESSKSASPVSETMFQKAEKYLGKVHSGPGKLTKFLKIDGSFNGESFCGNEKIRIEDDGFRPDIITAPRVGIDYAGDYWKNVEWRFISNGK